MGELLKEKSRQAIAAVDLSEGARFLEEDFGRQSIVGWVQYKFGLPLELDSLRDKGRAIKNLCASRPRSVRSAREAELPVLSAVALRRP